MRVIRSALGLTFVILLSASVTLAAPKATKEKPAETKPEAAQPIEQPAPPSEPIESEPEPAAATPVTEETSAESDDAPPATPAPKTREKGFYLRMTGGPGITWASAQQTATLPDLTMQGLTGNVMINPGYMLLPGFALHGDVYAGASFARKVTTDEDSSDYSSEGAGLLMYTIGIGATYHAMPVDLYVSAGGGLTYALATEWTNEEIDGVNTVTTNGATTDPGYGGHGSIGKLFFVNTNWALGGSLNYNFQAFGRRDDSALSIQKAHTLWLGFTATLQPR